MIMSLFRHCGLQRRLLPHGIVVMAAIDDINRAESQLIAKFLTAYHIRVWLWRALLLCGMLIEVEFQ